MNTFYKLNGLTIEEVKTRQDYNTACGLIRGTIYQKKSDIPIPDGYKLEGLEFVKTAETIKKEKDAEIKQQLDELDRKSLRPIRAKLSGTQTPEDETLLENIESQAKILRQKL